MNIFITGEFIINIGETIKKLRKQKDMTQEQLAEYLNISPQAVSRWEINSTLPDITLIPLLANIFDVTTDILLGVDIDSKEKWIDDIIADAWNNHAAKGCREEELQILRDALKEYPNSLKIKSRLIVSIQSTQNPKLCITDEQKASYTAAQKEIISIGESVLAECTDDCIRHSVIQCMCGAYSKIGETEKARVLANKLPTTAFSKSKSLCYILKGNELYRHLQREIMEDLDFMSRSIQELNNTLDDVNRPYSTDEHIVSLKKIPEIYKIIFEDEDYGFYNWRIYDCYRKLTELYLTKNDTESALEHLRLAAKHAIAWDLNLNVFDAKEFTSLLFRGNKCSVHSTNMLNSLSCSLIEFINGDKFDCIRNHPELSEIIVELEKHAR